VNAVVWIGVPLVPSGSLRVTLASQVAPGEREKRLPVKVVVEIRTSGWAARKVGAPALLHASARVAF
jgi:hypothetical protein